MRVDTNKGPDEEEGQRLCGLCPGEEADESILQDEGNTDPGIEAAEVG